MRSKMYRTRLIIYFTIVLALRGVTPNTLAQVIEDPFAKGVGCYINGKYDEAAHCFSELCSPAVRKPQGYQELKSYDWCGLASPEVSCRACYWRAWCYYRLGNLDSAMSDFRTAMECSKYHDKAALMLAWIMLNSQPEDLDNLQSVLEMLNRIDTHEKLKEFVVLMKAVVNFKLGVHFAEREGVQAQSHFEVIRGLSTDQLPESSRHAVTFLKGIASCWLGYFGGALEYLRNGDVATIENWCTNGSDLLLYYKALAYIYQGVLDEAKTASQQIADSDRKRLLTAKIKFLKREYDECLSILNGYQDANGFHMHWYYKGWAHMLARHFIDSRRSFGDFKRDYPQATGWLKRMKRDAAFRELETAHIGTPDYRDDIFTTANINNRADTFQLRPEYDSELKIIIACKDLVAHDTRPSNDIRTKIAWGLLNIGRATGLIEKINRGKQLIPQSNRFFYALAQTIGKGPNYNTAETIFTSLVGTPEIPQDEIDYALANVKGVLAIKNNDQTRFHRADSLYQMLMKKGSAEACYERGRLYSNWTHLQTDITQRNTLLQEAEKIFKIVVKTNRGSWVDKEAQAKVTNTVGVDTLGKDKTDKIDKEAKIFQYDLLCDPTGALARFHGEAIQAMKKHHEPFAVPTINIDRLVDPDWLGIPPSMMPIDGIPVHIHIYAASPKLPLVWVDGSQWKVSKENRGYQYKSEGKVRPGSHNIRVRCDGFFDWEFQKYIYDEETIPVHLIQSFTYDLHKVQTIDEGPIISFCVEAGTCYQLKPHSVIKGDREYAVTEGISFTAMTVISDTVYLLSPEAGIIYRGLFDKKKMTIQLQEFIKRTPPWRPIDMAHFKTGSEVEFFLIDATNRILKFNARGNYIKETTEAEFKGDPLGITSHIAVDKGGKLYVADCGNHRILKFDQDLNHKGFCDKDLKGRYEIGEKERSSKIADSLFYPTAVAVNEEGIIYVADLSGRIQLFSQDGSHLTTLNPCKEGNFVAQMSVICHGKDTQLHFLERKMKEKDNILQSRLKRAIAK